MSEIDVIREADLKPGDPTPGIVRRRAFDVDGVLVAQSRVAAGIVSGWHHHGTRTLFGYAVSGSLRFDYGPGGKDSVEVHPGEYFRISPGAVHRDVNPSPTQELVVVNVLLGEGPSLVNVAGPAGWGRRDLSGVGGPPGRPSDTRGRGRGRGAV
ncbi:MAG: cupin domain-containing protein [Thermoplasmata archaeon]